MIPCYSRPIRNCVACACSQPVVSSVLCPPFTDLKLFQAVFSVKMVWCLLRDILPKVRLAIKVGFCGKF